MLTQLGKLYKRIVQNPKDVRFEDLDRLLRQYGFQRRQPSSGSSHVTYCHDRLPDILTIPYAKPVKAVYVKRALELIDLLSGGKAEEKSDERS
ncbi:type II toxin-antitoxin system HicA family toxin [Kyrpidia tusciae]|uniref:YcfA family protein n=1 Tax=Kyrpidia tusciae (strain DSM 2912 / NBRC 15312 / T2) TaxID=562970 RepID=D5WVK4_KYRT2|nr:conserved hypothetical protein [Kyrpidia tusciae DSM 2912]